MKAAYLYNRRHRFYGLLSILIICVGSFYGFAGNPPQSGPENVYDIEAAKSLCDILPLRAIEGIWIYPEDKVTVLITRRPAISGNNLTSFDIRVIETSDSRLRPGDIIGTLTETPESKKFEIELFTERKNNILLKPKTCMARLTEDEEVLLLTKDKAKLNFRFSFNPSVLLPKMWRIFRINTSSGSNSSTNPAVGMVKIYPSYDGNGSSKREPRYL